MMMLVGSKQSISISMEVRHEIPIRDDSCHFLRLARQDIQPQGVQHIIDSVVDSLLGNSDRRFIYVEMAFFWRWWMEQNDDMKTTVRQLVNTGWWNISSKI